MMINEVTANEVTTIDQDNIMNDHENGVKIHRKFWKEGRYKESEYEVGIGYEVKLIDEDEEDAYEADYEYTGKVYVYEFDDEVHLYATEYKEATYENLVDFMTSLNDHPFLKSVAMLCGVIEGDWFDMLMLGDDGTLYSSPFSFIKKEDDSDEKHFMFWQQPGIANAFRYLEFASAEDLKEFVKEFSPEHEKLTARECVNHWYETEEEWDGQQYWCEVSFVWCEGKRWFYENVNSNDEPVEIHHESDLNLI